MRYKVIACSVFSREIAMIGAHSDSIVDTVWIRQGLHNYPDLLRAEIQREIDRAEEEDEGLDRITHPPEGYAAIILGFGLCSGAVAGLRARRLPLVIPRSHDCIAILLGSHRRYTGEFAANPGTYWFSPGWIEHSTFPCGAQCSLLKTRLAERYGEDNAAYLVQLERDALQSYSRAALICWPQLDRDRYHRRVEEVARDFGWQSATISGDKGLLERLLAGQWNSEEVLVCPVGSTPEMGGEEVIRCGEGTVSDG